MVGMIQLTKCYVIHELDSAMCMNELMGLGDLLSVSAVFHSRFLENCDILKN